MQPKILRHSALIKLNSWIIYFSHRQDEKRRYPFGYRGFSTQYIKKRNRQGIKFIIERCLFFFLLILFFQNQSIAQSGEPIKVTKLQEKLNFDGKVDEPFWQFIPTVSLRQSVPNFNQPPTERSETRLAYDDKYLYLAGKNHLSKPEYLRGTALKRDAFDATTDYYGLVIDSYNDKENGLGFFTSPTAFRWDGTVANDAQGDSDVSIDWNTFWDVKTTTSDTMWTCEMRIPWSSLRFQTVDDKVKMGITIWWYIAAKNEIDIFPYISTSQGPSSQWKPSLMQEYIFEGIESRKPLYVAPYILGGLQQNAELDNNGNAYLIEKDPTYEAGLDVKYSITSNLTMDLTVNTDFAQVEADDQQVNLTRFSLFFPEKRLFFQERASIFNFNFDNFNRLFYSRRIGIDDDGNPIRIYGGAKLVGRAGKFDVGFLNMHADGVDDLNSENFTVFRLRKQAINQFSNIGGIFTNRTDLNGNYNSSYGLDGIFRVKGFDYLTVRMAQTFDNEQDNQLFSLDPTRLFLDWERRSTDGLIYKLSYSRSGENYNPGIGFELRGNTTNYAAKVGYGKVMGEDSKLVNWQATVDMTSFINNSTDTLETLQIAPTFIAQAKTGWFGTAILSYNREYVPEAFDLSDDIAIATGEYDFWQGTVVIGTPFQNFFSSVVGTTIGGFYGGDFVSFNFIPRWRINKHISFEGTYQFNRANFKNSNKLFTSQVGRLKAEYLFNTKLSLAAFLQYNSLEKIYSGNVRFRVNPSEGHDLYIVYNDIINGNRSREIPILPFSDNRAIVLKYTYTFQFGS